jgi:Tol biopolymer transport system component
VEEIAMKQYRCFWFILALLLVAACKSGDGDQGLIVYQTLDEDGQPQELVVVNPQGEEQHRVVMPDLVRASIATRASHQALLDTPDGVYLLDAEQGDIQKLAFEEGVFSYAQQFRFSGGGKRWMLIGNPQGNLTYLLDLESGRVRDMTILDTAPIFYGLFAPDEKHFVLGSMDLWLIPAEKPSSARRLGTGQTTFASSFSSDGKKIAYVQRNEADEFEVVIEDVNGPKSESFAFDSPVVSVTFVPQKKQLLLVKMDAVSLLSLDDGQERELLTFASLVFSPRLAPSGEKALFSESIDDAILWHLVDLKGGKAQSLDKLRDYFAYWWDPDHRWLFFIDDVRLGEGGRNFIALDLESGETRQAMKLDEATSYMGLSAVSADGKFGLVTGMTQDKKMLLWLLQADGGEPRLLAEAAGVQGAFSPDGKWVAVSAVERVDGRTETQLTLMETEGEETRLLGKGVRPVWVRPWVFHKRSDIFTLS